MVTLTHFKTDIHQNQNFIDILLILAYAVNRTFKRKTFFKPFETHYPIFLSHAMNGKLNVQFEDRISKPIIFFDHTHYNFVSNIIIPHYKIG